MECGLTKCILVFLQSIPWGAFFKTPSVWAMIYTHFCGNWGHYCIMAWLPSYFRSLMNKFLHLQIIIILLDTLNLVFEMMFLTLNGNDLNDHLGLLASNSIRSAQQE